MYPDFAPNFVGDVHFLEFGVYFLEVNRLVPLASVTGSDVVGNVRTYSMPVVSFQLSSPLYFSDLGVLLQIVTEWCHQAKHECLL